jgi:hypothetical protein
MLRATVAVVEGRRSVSPHPRFATDGQDNELSTIHGSQWTQPSGQRSMLGDPLSLFWERTGFASPALSVSAPEKYLPVAPHPLPSVEPRLIAACEVPCLKSPRTDQ